jgi:diguanylate cyclase (GGDEF)-like protein/PAS domain S-box-containing protein
MSGLWTWDQLTDAVSWSGTLPALHGTPAATTYAEHLAAVHPHDQEEADRVWQRIARDGGEDRLVYRARNGALLSALVQRVAVAGRPLVVGSVVQVTRAKKEELRFVDLFAQLPVGMAVLSDEGRFLEVNDALCQLLGRERAGLLAMSYRELVPPEDPAEPPADEPQAHPAVQRLERLLVRGDGTTFWGRVTMSRFGTGVTAYRVVSIEDISASRAARQQLLDLALRDPLTGLPNRRLLLDRLNTALARSRRSGSSVAVLFLDLDHLKRVNDALGHEAGDDLLLAVAGNLQAVVRASDTVARLGGDEFVIVFEHVGGEPELDAMIRRVLDGVRVPVDLGGEEVVVTASIGVVVAESGHDRPEELLRAADAAMYRAKRGGRSRAARATPGDAVEPDQPMALEAGLRRAVDAGELRLHYHPVVALDGRLVGLEALLRWQHPTRGLLLPLDFLSVAQPDVARSVTAWVLGRAVRDASGWTAAGTHGVTVSVNVPVGELREPGTAEYVGRLLDEAGLPASGLQIELLEHQLVEIEPSLDEIRGLHRLGVGLSVDNFGTGHSSLAYLRQLPLDAVKIDRSFIATICDDAEDAAIVRAVLDACRATHRTSVAEGVETLDQLRKLAELGCDAVQGNLFGTPAPLEELGLLLELGRVDLGELAAQA